LIQATDDVGRVVTLPRPARRIVSLVPSLTETLFALGCGEAVVGVTRYCTEPKTEVARLQIVGGTKNPDLARIEALQPDLVLVNAEENRREDFECLIAALCVFVTFTRRVADVPSLVRRLGALGGVAAAAERMAAEIESAVGMMVSDTVSRPRVFCPIWKNPWMSFNRDTYDDDMLKVAGGANVCGARMERYPTVTLEEIAAAQPEVVLLPDEPYVFRPKDLPAFEPLRATPAFQTNRVHFIDGKALSWYGARTAAGLRYLREALTK
jgi:ABC-type Fe3+-hydroxamate transport system substrate-binding protein